ncbi:MAG: GrpB-like predicted nucleotidyltransferase (UPF0157 family) [Myxococcota bacterium]|jgi:GrpB-like predicted nucleotidyltransferase (UPF0157 family)
MLGLRRHTVQLRPHDPRWLEAGQRLVDSLCDLALVEHVGSTAVHFRDALIRDDARRWRTIDLSVHAYNTVQGIVIRGTDLR